MSPLIGTASMGDQGDLERIQRNWEDALRITGSIRTGAVRAYDVIRVLLPLPQTTGPLHEAFGRRLRRSRSVIPQIWRGGAERGAVMVGGSGVRPNGESSMLAGSGCAR